MPLPIGIFILVSVVKSLIILVALGIMIMRFKDPGRARPFRVPGGPILVPALGVLSCLFLIGYLPPSSWWRFVG